MEQRRTQNLSTAHSQAGRAGGTMASLPRMIPVLAAMLIPTMAVFYIIKKPLLKKQLICYRYELFRRRMSY